MSEDNEDSVDNRDLEYTLPSGLASYSGHVGLFAEDEWRLPINKAGLYDALKEVLVELAKAKHNGE